MSLIRGQEREGGREGGRERGVNSGKEACPISTIDVFTCASQDAIRSIITEWLCFSITQTLIIVWTHTHTARERARERERERDILHHI